MATFNWPAISVSASSGPTQFVLDGADTEVLQDTGTPANSKPLPVALLNLDGQAFNPATNAAVETMDAAIQSALMEANSSLNAIESVNFATETTLAALAAEDFATETTLSALNAKVTAVNTGAVVISSSALPTGAATSANQTTVIGHLDGVETSLTSIDGKITAVNTGAVTISSALPAGTNVIGHVVVDSAPTTAVTGTFWQATQPVSGPLTDAQLRASPVPISGSITTSAASWKEKYTLTFSTSNVTTAAYTELAASTTNALTAFEIYTTTTEPLILATGAAASEVDKFYILPGGNAPNVIYLSVSASTRLSLKALNNTISSGYILVNCLG